MGPSFESLNRDPLQVHGLFLTLFPHLMFEVFSAYTWGQFAMFLVALVIAYYAVVAFIYYRHDFGSILKRPVKASVTGATPLPAALVRTASAFPSATVAAGEVALPNSSSDEQDEQQEEVAAVVTGSLPESTALPATPSTLGEDSDEQPSEDSDENSDDDDDHDEAQELDQVDTALIETMRLLGIASAVVHDTDETDTTDVDSDTVETHDTYALLPEYSFEPIAEPVASGLDILVVEERLYTAESVADFITQVKSGEKPAIPVELLDTSLATQMAGVMEQLSGELEDLFAEEF